MPRSWAPWPRCAVLSTAWNENIAEATYVLRAAVVAIGSVLAVPGHGAGSRVRSTVEVPLVARGRTLGALTMTTTADSGRTYDAEDARFAEVLAGRVAVALDP